MITKVHSIDLNPQEWKSKLVHSDDEWLILQYYGLKFMLEMMDIEIENTYHKLKIERGELLDTVYKEVIFPMEDEMMDVDFQLTDVEQELEDRQINVILDWEEEGCTCQI
jgi:hypothetical protein